MKVFVKIVAVFCFVLVFFGSQQAFSQRRIVQLSGIVLKADSTTGMPGAQVYIPKAGRGVTTNNTGFFSLPVQIGDSVIVTSIGYSRRHYIVPEDAPEFWTVIVEMGESVTTLPEFNMIAFPTEELFKETVLAMNVPMDENGIDKKAMSAELMALMARTTPMDGAANYRYYMSQYPGSIQNKFMPVTNPFFNVFNWAKFIKQLKDNKKNK